jgi:hypothetical protein
MGPPVPTGAESARRRINSNERDVAPLDRMNRIEYCALAGLTGAYLGKT